MRFQIRIVHECARADAGAVDDEIEFRFDVFQFFEAHVGMHLTARGGEAAREIIEIDGRVHQRHVDREAGGERTGNLSACAKPSRSEWHRPVRNLDIAAA